MKQPEDRREEGRWRKYKEGGGGGTGGYRNEDERRRGNEESSQFLNVEMISRVTANAALPLRRCGEERREGRTGRIQERG